MIWRSKMKSQTKSNCRSKVKPLKDLNELSCEELQKVESALESAACLAYRFDSPDETSDSSLTESSGSESEEQPHKAAASMRESRFGRALRILEAMDGANACTACSSDTAVGVGGLCQVCRRKRCRTCGRTMSFAPNAAHRHNGKPGDQ